MVEQHNEPQGAIAQRHVGTARLGIGLAQGLAGWALLRLVPAWNFGQIDQQAPLWSQNHPVSFATLATWTAILPLIVLAELPRMRRRHLGIYVGAALVVLAALVFYDFWREPLANNHGMVDVAQVRIWPSGGLMLGVALGLFISNQLLEHREARHRLFTHYAAHFEDSWMRGFQLVISLVFAGLVWGVLELGRGLFDLIKLDWFGHMIEHNWFRCPALAIAFAASVHLTDVRPALLRGMRNVGLILLSWLLPLLVLLGVVFLASLAFTGLQPLWHTRFAASLLLWSVAVALFLLNAAYNDGDPANLPPLPLRWAARVAGPMMLLLSALAVYAIGLRVGQHGWTPSRVWSAAVALVALIYSGGYVWAAFSSGPWMKPLERVNVFASLAILTIVVALMTPLADPARLAVNSQVARLAAGKTAPDQFDYQFLRFDAGRYGSDALVALTHDANPGIAARARVAQAATTRGFRSNGNPDPAATEPALSHVTVYPKGTKLPADFVAANISDKGVFPIFSPSCLHDGSACDIIVWPGTAMASPLLILREHKGPGDPNRPGFLPVYARGADGKWAHAGTLARTDCPGVVEALRNGQAVPVKPVYNDLAVGAVRLDFLPERIPGKGCSEPNPAPPRPAQTEPRAPAHMGPAFGNPAG